MDPHRDGTVPFVDLGRQSRELEPELRPVFDETLAGGDFILGRAVERFEEEFAAWTGAAHAVGVGNGLDALKLSLSALGVGPGDEVILPANTFIATALAVTAVGAVPVLVDCLERSQQIDPGLAAAAVTPRTRALVPVHLQGHPADMDRLLRLAADHGVLVVEDAAQAHGARLGGRACGTFGHAGCFSFYPAKNLGAFGDGGMIVTGDADLAARLRQLRNYGQREKNEHVAIGVNSRLDTLQAAVLRVKLRHLDEWNRRRARHAARYGELLQDAGVVLPEILAGASPVFHLYVVRSPQRDALRRHLQDRGIQTGIHYPVPVHLQPAYAALGHGRGAFPVAERLADEILSLPMFPELEDGEIRRVADAIREFHEQQPA